jgi:tryptophanyl-tRNA synthetase
MSKSYDNTIPLFTPCPAEEAHRQHRDRLARARRAQGSRRLGPVPDLPGLCHAEETAALRQAYADGIAWGDAKQKLFERIDREIAPCASATKT